ncbi:MAG: class I SAM-dependent methyltransferase [Solirubrobacteraceae bacterium]
MLFQERHRAESFGAVAEQYDRTRPSYPPELIDVLLVDQPRSALDVGCGTGIASVLLRDRGVRVLGVEVDERMASLARAKGIEVEVGKFEEWERGHRRFDLLAAGQSWHWVDPRLGAMRAAQAISPGGRIGLFWNFGGPPAQIQQRIDPIYARIGPSNESPGARASDRAEATLGGLRQSGAFEELKVERFQWSVRYETASWLEQLATQSDHQTLPPEQLSELLDALREAIDELGGSFEVEYQTPLVTARRFA